MNKPSILWIDDEIDLLTPHIQFIAAKGYEVRRCSSGADAISMCHENPADLILLDENMPGLSGIETLEKLKELWPEQLVIMITNSQDEHIVQAALEGNISDFLVKPLLPNQLAISITKVLGQKTLISQKLRKDFLSQYKSLQELAHTAQTLVAFEQLYQNLVHWQLIFEEEDNGALLDMVSYIQLSANKSYSDFVASQYPNWFLNEQPPLLSHHILKEKIIPAAQSQKTMVLLLDNLRLDHWETIKPLFKNYFSIYEERLSVSTLPTVTQFARNSIFAGMTAEDIQHHFPEYWESDHTDSLKNEHEAQFLKSYIQNNKLELKTSYHKINKEEEAQKILKNFKQFNSSDLNFVVCNFIDQLSHASTGNQVIKSMTPTTKAYRKAVLNWFENSAVYELVAAAASNNLQLIVCTDHGSVAVKKPSLLKGNKDHTDNLRYKHGHRIESDPKESVVFSDPHKIGLPKNSLASSYVFAKSSSYFVYPNQYNKHANYFKDSYQHGGISLEEMLVPLAIMKPLK